MLNICKRDINKLSESKRIEYLVNSVNNNTPLGSQIKKNYHNLFNLNISHFEKKASNSDHYDILIHHSDNTNKKCEEKGSDTYIEDTNKFNYPWENSVQRYNGIGNKFEIGIKYAKLWYELVIDSKLKEKYNLKNEIPNQEEWLIKDAFVCSDPNTLFGRELKSNYRDLYGNTSMNGKNGSPFDYREIVNPVFVEKFSDDDKQILMTQTQQFLDDIMDEKECWLQTTGTLDNKISFKWYDKIESPRILDVNIAWKKGADIYFNFITDKKKNDFSSILRFGKGTGFSNIRYDIR
jgi:hypothetical protein